MEAGSNWLKLRRWSLLFAYYAYIDTQEYLADPLFLRYRARVKFGSQFGREGEPYRIILCRVRKREETQFRAALADLERKMLLCGHPDYLEFCSCLIRTLKRITDRDRERRMPHETACTLEKAE